MFYESLEDWKYRVIKTQSIATPMRPKKTVRSEFATLTTRGRLYMKKGLCWDGASGAFDTKSVMLPSCAHDVGCSWYLKGLIGDDMHKEFDELFKALLYKEVGKGKLARIRAAIMYNAVKVNTRIRYGI